MKTYDIRVLYASERFCYQLRMTVCDALKPLLSQEIDLKRLPCFSLPPDVEILLSTIRAHWSIENNFHWGLDVVFREDNARLRILNGAENFAVLRRFALNLLKRNPAKLSLKRKRFKAALNDTFLSQLLQYF